MHRTTQAVVLRVSFAALQSRHWNFIKGLNSWFLQDPEGVWVTDADLWETCLLVALLGCLWLIVWRKMRIRSSRRRHGRRGNPPPGPGAIPVLAEPQQGLSETAATEPTISPAGPGSPASGSIPPHGGEGLGPREAAGAGGGAFSAQRPSRSNWRDVRKKSIQCECRPEEWAYRLDTEDQACRLDRVEQHGRTLDEKLLMSSALTKPVCRPDCLLWQHTPQVCS